MSLLPDAQNLFQTSLPNSEACVQSLKYFLGQKVIAEWEIEVHFTYVANQLKHEINFWY